MEELKKGNRKWMKSSTDSFLLDAGKATANQTKTLIKRSVNADNEAGVAQYEPVEYEQLEFQNAT